MTLRVFRRIFFHRGVLLCQSSSSGSFPAYFEIFLNFELSSRNRYLAVRLLHLRKSYYSYSFEKLIIFFLFFWRFLLLFLLEFTMKENIDTFLIFYVLVKLELFDFMTGLLKGKEGLLRLNTTTRPHCSQKIFQWQEIRQWIHSF